MIATSFLYLLIFYVQFNIPKKTTDLKFILSNVPTGIQIQVG